MKWFLFIIFILALIFGAWLFLKEEQDTEVLIGGDRDEHGCIIAAGYSFNENIGACVRQFELTEDIEEAARMAVEYVGEGYALTVVSFNSYEEPGAYDIALERGEERTPEIVYIRGGEIVPQPSSEDAEMTGFQFMQDVIAVAPPNVDVEAEDRLYDALSSAAREEVSYEMLLPDIARFVGIQDVPDQGVSVEDLQIEGLTAATLTLGLNYSGGRALREVHLVIGDGMWKVDRISIPDQAERFEAVGNLVRNNPGMDPDVWHLVYEESGAPGLIVKLQFTQASICARGVENDICNYDMFEQGQRVHVSGERVTESAINVVRLEFR